MFLNDACDVHFDTQHRTERPIPSGAISVRSVWLLSVILLSCGVVLLAALGKSTALIALGLLVCIVAYDLIHKRTALAPLLMAGCRLLLYLAAGSAALGGISVNLLWCGGALAAYIIGLSFIARREAQNVKPNLLVLPLFVAPLLSGCVGLTFPNAHVVFFLCVAFIGWVIWSLWHMIKGGPPAIGRGVSALLAGIVLVDMLAVQGCGGAMLLVFVLLFVSALILQRKIPAT